MGAAPGQPRPGRVRRPRGVFHAAADPQPPPARVEARKRCARRPLSEGRRWPPLHELEESTHVAALDVTRRRSVKPSAVRSLAGRPSAPCRGAPDVDGAEQRDHASCAYRTATGRRVGISCEGGGRSNPSGYGGPLMRRSNRSLSRSCPRRGAVRAPTSATADAGRTAATSDGRRSTGAAVRPWPRCARCCAGRDARATPDATPDTTPILLPDAVAGAMADAVPDATLDARSDATPDASPDAAADAMPDVRRGGRRRLKRATAATTTVNDPRRRPPFALRTRPPCATGRGSAGGAERRACSTRPARDHPPAASTGPREPARFLLRRVGHVRTCAARGQDVLRHGPDLHQRFGAPVARLARRTVAPARHGNVTCTPGSAPTRGRAPRSARPSASPGTRGRDAC